MVMDEKETLAVQCIVTETMKADGKGAFSEEELAKVLMEKIEFE